MTDLHNALLGQIERSLDTMTKAPRMWGAPESLELQALLLLEIRSMVVRPHARARNPGELRDVYERFKEQSFQDAPATLMSYILAERGLQAKLPDYIQQLRDMVEVELPEEDPALTSPLVLDVQFAKKLTFAPFHELCQYFELFFRSVVDVSRRRAQYTEFAVPTVRASPPNGVGPRAQILLGTPVMGIPTFELTEDLAFVESLKRAMYVARWACDAQEPSPDALRRNFNSEPALKMVTRATKAMFPANNIESVTVGGVMMGDNETTIMARSAYRLNAILEKDAKVTRFSAIGRVEKTEWLQGWFKFRLQYAGHKQQRVFECWAANQPSILQQASVGAPNALVKVVGRQITESNRSRVEVDDATPLTMLVNDNNE